MCNEMVTILILHDNDFGLSTAQKFKHLFSDNSVLIMQTITQVEKLMSQPVANVDHLLVLANREMPKLITDVQQWIQGTGIYLHLVYLQENILYLGPHFRDGQAGCYTCFTRRRLTHMSNGSTPTWEKVIERYQAANPQDMVPGYPPVFPVLAAAHLYRVLDSLDDFVNSVSHVSAVNHSIKSGSILPLHGCQCRGSVSDETRFYRSVEQLLGAACDEN